MRSPSVCASCISMPSGEAAAVKQSASLADLRILMLAGKHQGCSAPRGKGDPLELLRSLESSDDDDDDDDGNTLHYRQRRRR